jgi:hypothetical protein
MKVKVMTIMELINKTDNSIDYVDCEIDSFDSFNEAIEYAKQWIDFVSHNHPIRNPINNDKFHLYTIDMRDKFNQYAYKAMVYKAD